MIRQGKPGSEAKRDHKPQISNNPFKPPHTTMDLKTPIYMQTPHAFSSNRELPLEGSPSFYIKNKENPFEDSFPDDPLCDLNLKETSDFVKALPMAASKNSMEGIAVLQGSSAQRREEGGVVGQRRLEAPTTPGRPVFSFSVGSHSRKGFPSKWDDAEKWLISSSSCHESPAHVMRAQEASRNLKQNETIQQKGDHVFAEKCRVTEEKVSGSGGVGFNGSSLSLESTNSAFHGALSEVLLKDKFTDNVEPFYPNFKYSEPAKEGFLFRNSFSETMKDAATEVVAEVQHRDIGTDMTPIGSSTTSRSHTPFKSSSPARHNTPANRSGPLVASNAHIDFSELQNYHLAKLQLGTDFDLVAPNWSSREEEDEEISKSLRHFEMGGCRKSIAESRASAWEDEEKTKCCLRYQREDAKIQAWVNLQNAKAEAQSRKLEVKIQKMRSNLEEKLMRRMAIVHRRAENWRASAQLLHSQQLRRASEQAQKIKSQHGSSSSDRTSCGCFPCNNHI